MLILTFAKHFLRYTALHIATKDGQDEVASVLLDHGASLTAATKVNINFQQFD